MKNSSENQTYFETAAENKRVLIVDDHPIVAHAIASVLQSVDLSLEIVINSCFNTAWAALQKEGQQHPWHRIFLDLNISGSQGLFLLRRCAELGVAPDACRRGPRENPRRGEGD